MLNRDFFCLTECLNKREEWTQKFYFSCAIPVVCGWNALLVLRQIVLFLQDSSYKIQIPIDP